MDIYAMILDGLFFGRASNRLLFRQQPLRFVSEYLFAFSG